MKSRILAFLITSSSESETTLDTIKKIGPTFSEIWVFKPCNLSISVDSNLVKVENFPDECVYETSRRNYINSFFRQRLFNGFLYVMAGNLDFQQDIAPFEHAIESTMMTLDYSVWFSTISDPCNYVYSKYNPRVSIDIDDPQVESLDMSKRISFTSHANIALVIYDFENATEDNLKFNESFDIPMYFIIEFLARRRNTKAPTSLYFMNQYMTVAEEIGLFTVKALQADEKPQDFTKEDSIFKSMSVNYNPDNNIDMVIETLYKKMLSKI